MTLRKNEILLTTPTLLWLAVFFVIPSFAMLLISFRPANVYGGVEDGWTLDAWRALADPDYPIILWRTTWLSLVTTAVCLALALPIAFFLGKLQGKWRGILLMLVIVPFWTNFVIRVAAWRILLHPEGMLRQALLGLGVIGPDTLLLYNEGAVLMVMVYTHLPFAVLPLYAAAERFDYSLLEAARDLGASGFRSVMRVFVPGVSRGLLTAMALVLIPALGSYVIPDLVGGPSDEMIGNKIAQRTLGDRNLPQAATLSVALLAITMIPILVVFLINRKEHASQP
ncbi:MAG: ABC transporter permease [Verrucomicrobiales bacterium]|jgi:spermidine/putrescine transport system permease protein|nr:ABC transporter permease [Verrucomicrobiales bacterium]